MKLIAGFVVGVLTGLAFSRIPHYYKGYAAKGLPPEYAGPRFRSWKNGVEV